MILSISAFAFASEAWPCSAAARPFAINVWRSSIVSMMNGQTNFMQNQTNAIIAITWPISVMFMSTRILPVLAPREVPGAHARAAR
jgi:hypothetical protein